MNEEIDDTEFYHEDFTTASDWEIFIAHLEEIISQWRSEDLHETDEKVQGNKVWDIKAEKIVFIDSNFNLTWYKKRGDDDALQDSDKSLKHPLNTWHDFSTSDDFENDHKDICLSRWYGLSEFIVLSPAGDIGIIDNESRAKILLSSASILISNLQLDIPIFMQIKEMWQKVYVGLYEGNGVRTNFDIVHLKRTPHYCQYLNGLLDMFKLKIMSPCTIDNIVISLQETFLLENFGNFIWKQDSFGDVEDMFILPFGVTAEPVSVIAFKAMWNHLSEHSIIDGNNFFDPLKAPKWYCSVKFTEDPVSLLGECLSEVHHVLSNNSTVFDVLGDFAALPTQEANPFDVLTEPVVPTISTLLSKAATSTAPKTRKGIAPIPDNKLTELLYFLFPDAVEHSQFPYSADGDNILLRKFKFLENSDEEFKGFKTCPEDSLVWRLSIVLSHCLQHLGGLKAFCHMWYEFTQEMRYRWENSKLIPGISPGVPDCRTCLLHQKLQMLNCCMDRKVTREIARYSSAQESDESEEEFFDASEEGDETDKKSYPLWDKPVGRLSKFGEMKLLNTGDPMYIPFTQDPVLKTEDQLEEEHDLLLQLGSDQEASELRARLLCASLLSDMESFKAANPGAVLEDFIRWYSPNDWIEDEGLDEHGQKNGHLSKRMQLKDNIWVDTWRNSRPVPANRQKRLFDDTREAEKVLQFLDFRTISQIAECIAPVLSHAAILRLADELENLPSALPDGANRVSNLLKQCKRMSREIRLQPKRFEVFAQEVTALEVQISQVNSLHYKLNPSGQENEGVNRAIGDLVSGKEVKIVAEERSQIGSRLISMFTDVHRINQHSVNDQSDPIRKSSETASVFAHPEMREFVLRANCIRPNLYSTKSPQFLRAILAEDHLRLVGAFSEDTAFF